MMFCSISSSIAVLLLSCAAPKIDAKDAKGPELVEVAFSYKSDTDKKHSVYSKRAIVKVKDLPKDAKGVRVTLKFEFKNAKDEWKELPDSSVILTTNVTGDETSLDTGFLKFAPEKEVEYRVTASGVYEDESAKPLGKIKSKISNVVKPIP